MSQASAAYPLGGSRTQALYKSPIMPFDPWYIALANPTGGTKAVEAFFDEFWTQLMPILKSGLQALNSHPEQASLSYEYVAPADPSAFQKEYTQVVKSKYGTPQYGLGAGVEIEIDFKALAIESLKKSAIKSATTAIATQIGTKAVPVAQVALVVYDIVQNYKDVLDTPHGRADAALATTAAVGALAVPVVGWIASAAMILKQAISFIKMKEEAEKEMKRAEALKRMIKSVVDIVVPEAKALAQALAARGYKLSAGTEEYSSRIRKHYQSLMANTRKASKFDPTPWIKKLDKLEPEVDELNKKAKAIFTRLNSRSARYNLRDSNDPWDQRIYDAFFKPNNAMSPLRRKEYPADAEFIKNWKVKVVENNKLIDGLYKSLASALGKHLKEIRLRNSIGTPNPNRLFRTPVAAYELVFTGLGPTSQRGFGRQSPEPLLEQASKLTGRPAGYSEFSLEERTEFAVTPKVQRLNYQLLRWEIPYLNDVVFPEHNKAVEEISGRHNLLRALLQMGRDMRKTRLALEKTPIYNFQREVLRLSAAIKKVGPHVPKNVADAMAHKAISELRHTLTFEMREELAKLIVAELKKKPMKVSQGQLIPAESGDKKGKKTGILPVLVAVGAAMMVLKG